MNTSISTLREQDVSIPCHGAILSGNLSIPSGAKGLVIFAHGSGRPFDVMVVRMPGLPSNPEVAFGAIASGGVRVLSEDLIHLLEISRKCGHHRPVRRGAAFDQTRAAEPLARTAEWSNDKAPETSPAGL